jgi:hypothetical protein
MRSHKASFIQGVLLLIILCTAVNTTGIRQLVFEHLQLFIIATCVAGIFYLQAHKLIRARERRLKEKIKDQSDLINNLLLANSINTRLVRDIALPQLFEKDMHHFMERLRESNLNVAELNGYGLNKKILAHYELFHYLGKAAEQQDKLNSAAKNNTEAASLSVVREMGK